MSSKFALVTGGAGFIGSHLVDRLVEEGWHVRVIDNFSTGKWENIAHCRNNLKVEVMKGDLKNPQDAQKAIKSVDVVFHYAANPEVRISTTNPKIHFNENVVATFNLLEAIRRSNAKELVFASSSSVYGEPENIPVSENSPIRPVSVYGASKAACENLIYTYSKLYGIRSLILRYANVVGSRLRHGVIYDFILKLKKNSRVLEILGDGKQIRSYIHISDAVEATLTAYKHMRSHFEVYNIGNEDWITVNEVADITTKALKLDDVKFVYKPVMHGVGWLGDVKKVVLDITKIKELGFRPRLNSSEATRKTVLEIQSWLLDDKSG